MSLLMVDNLLINDLDRAAKRRKFSCVNSSAIPDALPDVLPFFAGIVLITHRELVAHLLNTEPDWPWQKPTPKPLPSESITSKG